MIRTNICKLINNILVFVLMGLGQECVFTGLESGINQKNDEWMAPNAHQFMLGYSSVYYGLFYALVPLYIFLLQNVFFDLKQIHWLFKAIIYGLIFHTTEYFSMWTMMAIFGNYPSRLSYSSSPYSIHNFTRLDYFPFFMLSGLFFEHVYLKLNIT